MDRTLVPYAVGHIQLDPHILGHHTKARVVPRLALVMDRFRCVRSR